MTRDVLLIELQRIDSAIESAPWSEEALSAGIRHLQRNTDVMSEAQEYAEEPDKSRNLPSRYDGSDIARLRNLLPAIIDAIKSE